MNEHIHKSIRRCISVPTGDILVIDGESGPLECLSLGDYGREHNVKADFLGLNRELGEVKHARMLPLEDKWVITISTQYGCSMGCEFCDVPKVGPGRNASTTDLIAQVDAAMSLHPEVTHGRINLHYARMGEPTWNMNVIHSARELKRSLAAFDFHPVVSTMMPRHNTQLSGFIQFWLESKAEWDGNAGLQLSINSTSEYERIRMFHNNAMSLEAISWMFTYSHVVGRKIALNFAVADYIIDAKKLRRLFDPAKFMVKLTPMHRTAACWTNGIRTPGDATTLAPYRAHEEALKAEGFDVLVFIASHEEDAGRITCGNAILSGTMPERGTEHAL